MPRWKGKPGFCSCSRCCNLWWELTGEQHWRLTDIGNRCLACQGTIGASAMVRALSRCAWQNPPGKQNTSHSLPSLFERGIRCTRYIRTMYLMLTAHHSEWVQPLSTDFFKDNYPAPRNEAVMVLAYRVQRIPPENNTGSSILRSWQRLG
jgi:hypothetical protein